MKPIVALKVSVSENGAVSKKYKYHDEFPQNIFESAWIRYQKVLLGLVSSAYFYSNEDALSPGEYKFRIEYLFVIPIYGTVRVKNPPYIENPTKEE